MTADPSNPGAGDFRFIYRPADYAATVAFYRDQVGLRVVHSWEDQSGGTLLAAAGGQIELFGGGDATTPAPAGVALAWEIDDADSTYARITAAGVQALSEPTDQPWGHRSFTISAPDGLEVTLFQVVTAEW